MSEPGALFIVATPLGNLEDLTFRAARVLKEVDLIAAEDTRRTRKLTARYGLKTRIVSYREQNHARILPKLMRALEGGRNLALVSDAGTPGVSDPGALLVREAAGHGVTIIPVPGASAPACALSASGLPADSFLFAGFLPPKRKARQQMLEALKSERRTLVFFEAPHRLAESLTDFEDRLGDRPAVLCREMTKVNEEFIRGSLSDLAAEAARRPGRIRGEATLVVAGATRAEAGLNREDLAETIKGDQRPVREIVADLAPSAGLSRSELYRLVLEVTGREG